MRVAVLGASDNPERYAYKAVMRLKENGHTVFPVNPKLASIEGIETFASLSSVPRPIDTLSIYVSSDLSSKLAGEIFAAKPKRIVFNPGAENLELEAEAAKKGIQTLRACTLTMLATRQF